MKLKNLFLSILVLGIPFSNAVVSTSAKNPLIKVMSFNIRTGHAKDGENSWPHRHELLLETIQTFNPDLLGLQEVQDFQAEYLKEHLPEYAFYGVGRNDDLKSGEFVPVMFKRKRFEQTDAGYFWLSETPDVPGSKSWDSALPRIATWVMLKDKSGGPEQFVFGNTHLDHKGVVARLESARLIRKRINTVTPEMPVIVTGDFNTHEKLEPYAVLVNAQGANGSPLLDTYRIIHPEKRDLEGTFNAFTGERGRNRIDWILTTQNVATLNAAINYTNEAGRFPSDHYPVEAVLRIK